MREKGKPTQALLVRYAEIERLLKKNGPMSQSEIGNALGVKSSSASTMGKKMVQHGWLKAERNGTSIIYSLPSKRVGVEVIEEVEPVRRPRIQHEFEKDRLIAECAERLFGDVKQLDLFKFLQWVDATREMM